MLTIYSNIYEYLLDWNSRENNPSMSEGAHSHRERCIRKYIAPCIGQIPLNELANCHYHKLSDYLSNIDISEETQREVKRIFRQAIRYAEKHYLIKDSLADAMYLPSYVPDNVPIYSAEQINRIFNALKHEPMYNCYRLIFLTGIRCREAYALRLQDLDFDNNIIHIRMTMHGNTVATAYATPITRLHVKRDIAMTQEIKDVLQDELSKRAAKTDQYYWVNPVEDWLFTTGNGGPLVDERNVNAQNIVRTITGISGFNATALRYSAINIAMKNGASAKIIQDLAGFTTLNYVYSLTDHIANSIERSA